MKQFNTLYENIFSVASGISCRGLLQRKFEQTVGDHYTIVGEKRKSGKHGKNILFSKRKAKLICFDWECNLLGWKLYDCCRLRSYVYYIGRFVGELSIIFLKPLLFYWDEIKNNPWKSKHA